MQGCLFFCYFCAAMANRGFQFKRFKIEQEGAALKVGTDACILGAWAHHPAPARILDIGTGTGLLALMLAQRYDAPVEALEPEPEAAAHAQDNFNMSPWPSQIRLHELRVQDFSPAHPFDLIVCNPPFYPNHLKTANRQRNLALHQEELDFGTLARHCKQLLASQGLCYILLPPRQAGEFEMAARETALYPQQRLLVQERQETPIHRTVVAFGHIPQVSVKEASLVIRAENGGYSAAYKALLHDYYLIF